MSWRRGTLVTSGFVLVVLLSAAATSLVEQPDVQVYFSRVDDPQAAIIHVLDGASKTLHIALYYFTDPELAAAVVRAQQRGVQIYVYLDRSQVKHKYSQARYLAAQKVPVRISSNSAIMHNKFAIVDSAIVVTGSYNWSRAAYQRNDENVLIIRRVDVASRYKQRFASFWTKEFDLAATKAVRGN